MAWLFGLAAECGPSEEAARELAGHFGHGRVFGDGEGNWWCHVVPAGLAESVPRSASEAAAMTRAGHQLYQRLRAAPPVYRYALAGVETDQFRSFGELRHDDDLGRFPGLVLSDSLWLDLGRPERFVAFMPGYRWLPYEGEHAPDNALPTGE